MVGVYDNVVSQGQTRIPTAITRIIFPDSELIDLGSMSAADQSGFAGLHDEVNTHWWAKFGNALILGIAGAGVQLSQGTGYNDNNGYDARQIAAASLGQQFAELGAETARSGLTIRIRSSSARVIDSRSRSRRTSCCGLMWTSARRERPASGLSCNENETDRRHRMRNRDSWVGWRGMVRCSSEYDAVHAGRVVDGHGEIPVPRRFVRVLSGAEATEEGRGYLGLGSCPGGVEPVVKPVAAVAGDVVLSHRRASS